MKPFTLLRLVGFAAVAVARTEVMLPLYTAPGGATPEPDWQAAVDAIRNNPDMHFYVVINPNNGPRNTSFPGNPGSCNVWNEADNSDWIPHGCNKDWSTNVDILNQLPNVQTLGYVYTRYGDTASRSIAEIEEDIAECVSRTHPNFLTTTRTRHNSHPHSASGRAWRDENTWTGRGNISIHGIWFDETGISIGNRTEYTQLTDYARRVFDEKDPADRGLFSIVMNPGSNPDQDYEPHLFAMSDAVVVRETCWTEVGSVECPGNYVPFDVSTLAPGSGLPHDDALRPKSVVLVHQVRDPPAANNETLYEQIQGVVGLGLHSTYFTSAEWNVTTMLPASVGVVAEFLSRANNEAQGQGDGAKLV
ncbi:Spherulin-4 [Madurella mycetomatis]|uniref:Spherulin-4 n=1 Tax=Madurella mycetomatis TaxID=100816 RepID=A0A175VQ37_9PEZI|nr:Spherulin-4 [Madurella mycetomatis]